MAEQKGSNPVQGTIGNLTYFKSQDGFMVKSKSSVSKQKILSDPKFARTRENMAEFGNAGATGKIIRAPFSNLLQLSADNRMVSRLTSHCLKVLKTDATGKRGSRTVTGGDLSLFSGFEFNNKGLLSTTLLALYTVNYNRTSGAVQFDLPAIIPQQGITGPQGATHYKMVLAASAIDLTVQKNQSVQAESAILPWNNTITSPLSLTVTLGPDSTLPIFILLQMQFAVQLNGDTYPLQNGAFNACCIIGIDTP